MYTGLVNHIGKVVFWAEEAGKTVLGIASQFSDFIQGESISVDGICLSVTRFDGQTFYCDLSPETLAITAANNFTVDRLVNVERSLRVGDRFGGHYVMGHVDQTCHVSLREDMGDCLHLTFSGVAQEGQRYFIPKGSVCINGVSLTVNKVEGDAFTVMLIPDTLAKTTLDGLAVGDSVNIEYDFMVKTVVNQLKERELVT